VKIVETIVTYLTWKRWPLQFLTIFMVFTTSDLVFLGPSHSSTVLWKSRSNNSDPPTIHEYTYKHQTCTLLCSFQNKNWQRGLVNHKPQIKRENTVTLMYHPASLRPISTNIYDDWVTQDTRKRKKTSTLFLKNVSNDDEHVLAGKAKPRWDVWFVQSISQVVCFLISLHITDTYVVATSVEPTPRTPYSVTQLYARACSNGIISSGVIILQTVERRIFRFFAFETKCSTVSNQIIMEADCS
jgi:hypothetical protein